MCARQVELGILAAELQWADAGGRLAAVLRSWEDRFGGRVIEVGFDRPHLTVASSSATAGHAEHVAAEHFAICPDICAADGTDTIRDYAARAVLGKPDWWFRWD